MEMKFTGALLLLVVIFKEVLMLRVHLLCAASLAVFVVCSSAAAKENPKSTTKAVKTGAQLKVRDASLGPFQSFYDGYAFSLCPPAKYVFTRFVGAMDGGYDSLSWTKRQNDKEQSSITLRFLPKFLVKSELESELDSLVGDVNGLSKTKGTKTFGGQEFASIDFQFKSADGQSQGCAVACDAEDGRYILMYETSDPKDLDCLRSSCESFVLDDPVPSTKVTLADSNRYFFANHVGFSMQFPSGFRPDKVKSNGQFTWVDRRPGNTVERANLAVAVSMDSGTGENAVEELNAQLKKYASAAKLLSEVQSANINGIPSATADVEVVMGDGTKRVGSVTVAKVGSAKEFATVSAFAASKDDLEVLRGCAKSFKLEPEPLSP